jgi:hypothetical protein
MVMKSAEYGHRYDAAQVLNGAMVGPQVAGGVEFGPTIARVSRAVATGEATCQTQTRFQQFCARRNRSLHVIHHPTDVAARADEVIE